MVRINTRIHAVFVSKATGELLKEHAHWEEGERCIFPFQMIVCTVVAISFIFLIVILIAIFALRHWLYLRGKNQLPKGVDTKLVEALPCFSFSSACLGECRPVEKCVPFVLRITRIRKFLSSSLSTWISFELCSWLTKWEPNLWILRSKRRTWLYNSWM